MFFISASIDHASTIYFYGPILFFSLFVQLFIFDQLFNFVQLFNFDPFSICVPLTILKVQFF